MVSSQASGGAKDAPPGDISSAGYTRRAESDPAVLQIHLLGGFRVFIGERAIYDSEWYLRKAKHLVKLLAGSPERRLHRGELIDTLWPELDTDAGTNNLHKVLHIARRVLEPELPPKTPSSYLHMKGEFVYLGPKDSVWIDIEAFHAAADLALLSDTIEAYDGALLLYRGDLLPEDRYDDWAIRSRDSLRSVYFRLLTGAAALHQRHGELDRAIVALQQVVESEPSHEEAQIHLMQLFAASGQRQLALRQYRQLGDALMEELQIEPSNTAREVYERVLGSEPFVSVQTSPVPPQSTDLESGRDPLVGRDVELTQLDKEIDGLFAGHGNLVIVAGDNGLGKSRLVTEAADRASKRGAITLWSAAYRSRQSHSYHLFSVLLDSFALRIPPENLRDLLGTSGDILAGIAPNLARALDLAGELSAGTKDEGHIVSAMVDFFAQLTRFAPVAVVLDNLHLADDASLRLIGDLAGLLHEMPVLLLTAYRDADIAPGCALDQLRHRIAEEKIATVLQLRAISVSETERLAARVLGGIVDAPVVDAIYRIAAGNLHYTREAIEALQGRKRIVQKLGTWELRSGIAVTWGRDQLRGKPESGDFQLVRLLRA